MIPTLKHTTYSQQNYSNYIKYYMLLNQEFSINGYMINRSQSQYTGPTQRQRFGRSADETHRRAIIILMAYNTLYKPNNFTKSTPTILM